MYIKRKVYSLAYDETTGEERLFSTTEIISEEGYLQKEFARRDYAGLDEQAKKELMAERTNLANELRRTRNKINQRVGEKMTNLNTATNVVLNTHDELHKKGTKKYYDRIKADYGGEVSEMVGNLNSGKNPYVLKKEIIQDRTNQYNDKLRSIKDEANYLRDDALKSTKKREAQKAEELRRQAEEQARKNSKMTTKTIAKNNANSNLVKNLGKGALIVGGVTAVGYGAKKLYDKKKNKPEQEKTYSKKVYEGLTKSQAERLAKERRRIAKKLKSNIKYNNSLFKKDQLNRDLSNNFDRIDAIQEAKLAKKNILTGQNKKYKTVLERESEGLPWWLDQ